MKGGILHPHRTVQAWPIRRGGPRSGRLIPSVEIDGRGARLKTAAQAAAEEVKAGSSKAAATEGRLKAVAHAAAEEAKAESSKAAATEA